MIDRLRLPGGTLLAALLAAGGAWGLWLRPLRVEVHGTSMAPTLLPGDRLLAVRARRYAVGDLVVLGDPREPTRQIVKRLAALPSRSVGLGELRVEAGPGEVVVLGDNPDGSTDSRVLGPVRLEHITGRCVYRYSPAHRVGPMSGGVGRRLALVRGLLDVQR